MKGMLMAKRTLADTRVRLSAERTVHVRVSPKALYDLNSITKVLRSTLDRLGCRACCSGFDIRFDVERNFVAGASGIVRPG